MARNWDDDAYIGEMSGFLAFETFRRSRRPNNFLVAPEGFCENSKTDQRSPILSEPPSAVFEALVDRVEREKLWGDLVTDPAQHRLRFVARTPLLRFRDDVDIHVLAGPSETGSQIAVYSRSRLGHSDLGANAQRVRNMLDQLTAK
ncbi:MAG: DUF1499 domain-containing protein [Pseudomonadota bacterium]